MSFFPASFGGGHHNRNQFIFLLRLPRVGQDVPVLRHDADADLVGAASIPRQMCIGDAGIGNRMEKKIVEADRLGVTTTRRRRKRRRKWNLALSRNRQQQLFAFQSEKETEPFLFLSLQTTKLLQQQEWRDAPAASAPPSAAPQRWRPWRACEAETTTELLLMPLLTPLPALLPLLPGAAASSTTSRSRTRRRLRRRRRGRVRRPGRQEAARGGCDVDFHGREEATTIEKGANKENARRSERESDGRASSRALARPSAPCDAVLRRVCGVQTVLNHPI